MTENDNGNGRTRATRGIIRCANCGSARVTTTEVDDKFAYGEGASSASLQVRVPLRTCQDCGFQFLDDEAEDLRQEVIAEHRTTPQSPGVN